MIKLVPKNLSFQSSQCQAAINKLIADTIDDAVEKFIKTFKEEIERNGNGSKTHMIPDAVAQVKELLREVASDHIMSRVGIDEAAIRGLAEEMYVRIMVVLHGNQAGGALHEKPGVATFKKYVTAKSVNTTSTAEWPLPGGFNQGDVTDGIVENVLKEMEKYLNDFLRDINAKIPNGFFSNYVVVT